MARMSAADHAKVSAAIAAAEAKSDGEIIAIATDEMLHRGQLVRLQVLVGRLLQRKRGVEVRAHQAVLDLGRLGEHPDELGSMRRRAHGQLGLEGSVQPPPSTL